MYDRPRVKKGNNIDLITQKKTKIENYLKDIVIKLAKTLKRINFSNKT